MIGWLVVVVVVADGSSGGWYDVWRVCCYEGDLIMCRYRTDSHQKGEVHSSE